VQTQALKAMSAIEVSGWAEMGSRARARHVIVAALSLWAWSPLTACLMQRSVNRAVLRASEAR
jgi:hypothetical protein